MCWVCLRIQDKDEWVVGFYDPRGGWHRFGDIIRSEKGAMQRVHYLNGGSGYEAIR